MGIDWSSVIDRSEERQMAAQRISGLGKTLRAFLERPVSKRPKQGFCAVTWPLRAYIDLYFDFPNLLMLDSEL